MGNKSSSNNRSKTRSANLDQIQTNKAEILSSTEVKPQLMNGYMASPLTRDKLNEFNSLLFNEVSWGLGKEDTALIEYFNFLSPQIKEQLEEMEESFPEEFTSSFGTLTNFFENSFLADRNNFEKFVYEEMINAMATTNAQYSDMQDLLSPHTVTKSAQTIEKDRLNHEQTLIKTQEKVLDSSAAALGELNDLLNSSFPGLFINSDGSFNLSKVDLKNSNISFDSFEQINALFSAYKKQVMNLPRIKNNYSFTGIEEFTDRFLQGNISVESRADAINNNQHTLYNFLGSLSTASQEIVRDKNRAERFIGGERFWANDSSGGIYSSGMQKMGIMVPNAMKMAAIISNNKLYLEDGIYENTIDTLQNRPEAIVKEMVGIMVHEYGHHISFGQARNVIEESRNFQFSEIKDIWSKIKNKVPRSEATSLMDENFGMYALSSPSEFYAEAMRFLRGKPENVSAIKRRFEYHGLDNEFKQLMVAVGL